MDVVYHYTESETAAIQKYRLRLTVRVGGDEFSWLDLDRPEAIGHGARG